MARPIVIVWPHANTTAIAALQTLGAAGNLALVAGGVTNNASARTIGLTSTNDLSGVNFTITGMLNGSVVSETRVGPNNNTVYTTQLFNYVTSISTNAAATAVSAGTGTTGATQWIEYNYHATVANVGVQVQTTGTTSNITYSFEYTCDNVNTITSPAINTGIVVPQPGNADAFQTVMSATAQNDSVTAYANFMTPCRYYRIHVTAQGGTFDGSLIATFIQQGIN